MHDSPENCRMNKNYSGEGSDKFQKEEVAMKTIDYGLWKTKCR